MKRPLIPCCISLIAALGMSSCDDPKLVEQREKQKTEIARLKGEVALVELQLKSMPPDVAKDLAQVKKQGDEQAAEITRLEAEVTELEGRKRALQSEFDFYRAKYPVK